MGIDIIMIGRSVSIEDIALNPHFRFTEPFICKIEHSPTVNENYTSKYLKSIYI